MKKQLFSKTLLFPVVMTLTVLGCKKDNRAKSSAQQYSVTQTNLVADATGFGAAKIDPNLLNAWGLAVNPNSTIWVSSNHKGLTTIYDSTGKTLLAPVNIITTVGNTAAPTGIVFNETRDFQGNKFIFCGEDGTITAWTTGGSAAVVFNGGANAVYKGLAMGNNGGKNFLYAANFKAGKIEVFDGNFQPVNTAGFTDTTMPAGFAPFNVQNIEGSLYVAYAKQAGPDNADDSAAPGNGYIDVFRPDGSLVKRFSSQGPLNSPWGMTLAPAGFAAGTATLLVGNFGDGKISVFDLNGNFKGSLQSDGQPLAISGLWALDFLTVNPTAASHLYFTAGPDGETHGLFGFLSRQMTNSSNNGTNNNNGGYPGY
jgi:uncharacterized protein (TIGR03118 family)